MAWVLATTGFLAGVVLLGFFWFGQRVGGLPEQRELTVRGVSMEGGRAQTNMWLLGDLDWLATMVAGEARGEPWLGQLGVAYTAVNRAKQRGITVCDVLMEHEQFYLGAREMDGVTPEAWYTAYRAAAAAYFGLVPDPTRGAVYFLNVALTKKRRPGGTLPPWARSPVSATEVDHTRVAARIGNHTFLWEAAPTPNRRRRVRGFSTWRPVVPTPRIECEHRSEEVPGSTPVCCSVMTQRVKVLSEALSELMLRYRDMFEYLGLGRWEEHVGYGIAKAALETGVPAAGSGGSERE